MSLQNDSIGKFHAGGPGYRFGARSAFTWEMISVPPMLRVFHSTARGKWSGCWSSTVIIPSDITNYENQAGLPNVPLQNVLIDCFNGTPGGNNGEVALDIEMAIAMAPGLSNVIVYEGPNGGNIVDMLNRMATDNLAKQISSSWLIGDNPVSTRHYKLWPRRGSHFFRLPAMTARIIRESANGRTTRTSRSLAEQL